MTSTIDQYNGSIVPAEAIAEAQRGVEAVYNGGEGIGFFGHENPAKQEPNFLDAVAAPSHDSLADVAFNIAKSSERKLTPGQVVDLAKKTGGYLEHMRAQALGPEQFDLVA